MPLLAVTTRPEVRSQLALVWGCETFVAPPVHHTDEMVAMTDQTLLQLGRGRPGDYVVVVAGTPPGQAGGTNTLRVHRLGDE
jgi:pyruvate kinase